MKLIDGDNLIEHAEVNCESSDFVEKLIDYVSEQEEISISQDHENDLISRRKAIEALESKTYRHTYLDQIVGIIKDLPSAQSEVRTQMSSTDCISRQAAIDAAMAELDGGTPYDIPGKIERLPAAQPEQQWIPVKFRPMDSEEREYWEEQLGEELADEDAVMFDCPIPKDGQEILVSYRKWISMDKCEIDGGFYGLEGNDDWDGVTAWMPLPEPFKEVEE